MIFHRVRDGLEARRHYGALFVRLVVGVHLIVECHDQLLNWDALSRFSDLLAFHGVPWPMFSAVISLSSQAFAGVAFLLGAATRPAAALMIVNFIVALVTVHAGDSYAEVFPALVMLAGSLFLFVHGAGRPSVDAMLAEKLFDSAAVRDDSPQDRS